jgi:Ca2+-dependent lipid-binding protein
VKDAPKLDTQSNKSKEEVKKKELPLSKIDDGGTLTIKIIQGKLHKNTDAMGKMDPYVILEHAGKVYQTPAIKEGGQIPEWNFVVPEDFKFKASPNLGENTIFKMKCMDDDFGKDDEVG